MNNNISTAGSTLALCGSCDCLFSQLEVLHKNNIIETTNDYDLLSSILLDSQGNAEDRARSLSITKGCKNETRDMTGANITIAHDRYFSTTLLSGVVGSLARTIYTMIQQLELSAQLLPQHI